MYYKSYRRRRFANCISSFVTGLFEINITQGLLFRALTVSSPIKISDMRIYYHYIGHESNAHLFLVCNQSYSIQVTLKLYHNRISSSLKYLHMYCMQTNILRLLLFLIRYRRRNSLFTALFIITWRISRRSDLISGQ